MVGSPIPSTKHASMVRINVGIRWPPAAATMALDSFKPVPGRITTPVIMPTTAHADATPTVLRTPVSSDARMPRGEAPRAATSLKKVLQPGLPPPARAPTREAPHHRAPRGGQVGQAQGAGGEITTGRVSRPPARRARTECRDALP